jgi:hypothetical protein
MSVLLLQRPGNCRVQRLKPHLLACGCLGGSHAVDSCSGRLVLRLLALPPRFLRLALDSLRSWRLVAQRSRRRCILRAGDRRRRLDSGRLRWYGLRVVRDGG